MGISNRLTSLENKVKLLLGEREKKTEKVAQIERSTRTLPVLQARIEAIGEDIAAVERVIRIDHPNWKRDHLTPARPFEHKIPVKLGNATRLAMDILRTASEPLTGREIAIEVLRRSGHESPHPHTIIRVANTIGNSLRKRHKDGFVASDGCWPARWSAIKPNR